MFCIVSNLEIDRNKEIIKRIQDYLALKNISCSIADVMQDSFGNYVYTNIPSYTKYIIALGGDGTILQAAKHALMNHIPILGINTGTLGFLAESRGYHIEEYLERILQHNFQLESRLMLEVYKDNEFLDYALNDAVIAREGFSRIVSLDVKVDGVSINKYRGDGVVISTPTGSTGYNLSLGGPILSPTSKNVLITPIACHSLYSRPIVLSDKEVVTIELLESRKTQTKEAILTCDGRKNIDLHCHDILTLKPSEDVIELIQFQEHNFFQLCNQKLREF